MSWAAIGGYYALSGIVTFILTFAYESISKDYGLMYDLHGRAQDGMGVIFWMIMLVNPIILGYLVFQVGKRSYLKIRNIVKKITGAKT
jgi:hypothetical protein